MEFEKKKHAYIISQLVYMHILVGVIYMVKHGYLTL